MSMWINASIVIYLREKIRTDDNNQSRYIDVCQLNELIERPLFTVADGIG